VVDFSATPLFAEANLLPGDAVARTVTVTNTGVEAETVEFGFENVINGPLATEMELVVDNGSTVYVDDTFTTLFAGDSYPLGTLGTNESRTYTFTAALPPTAPNPLQTETFGFDLLIGFAGAEAVSDRARAFSGGSRTLQLFNEAATVEEELGGAFVTWNSNRPASSYLVCGVREAGPFSLSEEAPLFGYDFALEEQVGAVTSHGLALSDLDPGEYECRPAGRTRSSAGFTVGDPVRFTIPEPVGAVAGARTSVSPQELQEFLAGIMESRPGGSVLGVSGKGGGNLSYAEFRAGLAAKVAAATSSREVKDPKNPDEYSQLAVANESDSRTSATATENADSSEDSSDWSIVGWSLMLLTLFLTTWTVWARKSE
jgi:hypothetical protein